jgi:hypothetical protein
MYGVCYVYIYISIHTHTLGFTALDVIPEPSNHGLWPGAHRCHLADLESHLVGCQPSTGRCGKGAVRPCLVFSL